MMTKAEATAKGKRLLKRMGPKWKLDIWENLGWHYCLLAFPFSLWEYGPKEYHVLMSNRKSDPTVGDLNWYDSKSYKTPEAALKATFARAEAHMKHVQSIVEEARQVLA